MRTTAFVVCIIVSLAVLVSAQESVQQDPLVSLSEQQAWEASQIMTKNAEAVAIDDSLSPLPAVRVPGGSYSPILSKKLLYFSYGAYCGESAVKKWSCKWCSQASTTFQVVNYIDEKSSSTELFIGYDSSLNQIIVTYRGSHELQDWITNLNFAKHKAWGSIGNVHDGFLEAYKSVQSAVKSDVAVLKSKYPSAGITITGHSLGGALAALTAADLSFYHSNINLHTFGQPRVGDQTFANFLNGRAQISSMFRVVNDHDIVPHLPPHLMGFRHAAREIWYTDSTDYTVCNSVGEDDNCSDSIAFPISIHDHLHYMGISESC